MKSKQPKLKEYCVHVYTRADNIEGVKARTPEEAEDKALRQYDADEYSNVEVMRTCECGTDNDVSNKTCSDCGEIL